VKIHRWLTLAAALLITLCEVLVFDSQSARGPEDHTHTVGATDGGSSKGTRRSLAVAAGIHWADSAMRTRRGVR
jgi:hypothetical protein